MPTIGIVMGLIAMFCWGIADFFQAILVRRITTIKTIYISNIFSSFFTILLIGIYFYLGYPLILTIKDILLITFGCLLQVIATYNFFKGLEIGEVSVVTPISSSFSLVTVILAVLFLNEKLTILKFISILLIVIGVVFVSADFTKKISMKGIKEALIAALLWGIYFFILGLAQNNYMGNNSIEKIFLAINLFLLTNFAGGIMMIILALIKKVNPTFKGIINKKFIKKSWLLFANFLLFTGAWLAFNYGLVKDQVSILTPVSSLYPAVTVLMAWLFMKEKLVFNQKIGIFIVLLGIFLISI